MTYLNFKIALYCHWKGINSDAKRLPLLSNLNQWSYNFCLNLTDRYCKFNYPTDVWILRLMKIVCCCSNCIQNRNLWFIITIELLSKLLMYVKSNFMFHVSVSVLKYITLTISVNIRVWVLMMLAYSALESGQLDMFTFLLLLK